MGTQLEFCPSVVAELGNSHLETDREREREASKVQIPSNQINKVRFLFPPTVIGIDLPHGNNSPRNWNSVAICSRSCQTKTPPKFVYPNVLRVGWVGFVSALSKFNSERRNCSKQLMWHDGAMKPYDRASTRLIFVSLSHGFFCVLCWLQPYQTQRCLYFVLDKPRVQVEYINLKMTRYHIFTVYLLDVT